MKEITKDELDIVLGLGEFSKLKGIEAAYQFGYLQGKIDLLEVQTKEIEARNARA
jgi:hypothetical protein